ncbi:UNVERIFIED_CONTAM: hypothetical protein Sradi_3247100 [Sesamum radiatum]|uniref:Uncharacterized protein n=1 Tax=Sesamum radiatum TaxID=300843 RepID=A0AAW2QZT6_SESRA
MAPTSNWLNHCWAALAKLVTKTRYLIPSVYLCKRAMFAKRERCSKGSIVPSYSAIAGVWQFAGISSAITTYVKGTLCLSSSGAPPI